MAAVSRARFPSPAKLLAIAIALGLVFGLYRLVLHQLVTRYVQNLTHAIPGCTGIRYSRLDIPLFSLQAYLQDVTLDFADGIDPVAIDAIHLRRFRPGDQLPRSLDVALVGIALDASHPLLPLGNALRNLGYPALRGDLHIQWERRGEAQDVWDLNIVTKMAEAGEMTLSFQLAKVNIEGIVLALAQPYYWLMVLPAVELMEFRGIYIEGGLFERVIRALARTRGQSPEAFREALQHQLQLQRQREPDPAVQSVWQSLAIFCHHPDRIRLRTDLARPIPLGQLLWLRQPRDFIQRLALECRAG